MKITKEYQAHRKINKSNSVTVFFDLKKAYDSMPKNILIKKMLLFDIPENIIRLISNMQKNHIFIWGIIIKIQKDLRMDLSCHHYLTYS